MWIKFKFDEETEEGRYFMACARLRGCSPTGLFGRLFEAIHKDQMIAAILDDEDKIINKRKRKGEQKFSEKKFGAVK